MAVFAILAAVAFAQWLLADLLLADMALLVGVFTIALERPRRCAPVAGPVLEVGVILASVRHTRRVDRTRLSPNPGHDHDYGVVIVSPPPQFE
jgi:hypothetical protein